MKENDRRKGRGERERQRELTKVSARCAEEEEPREGNLHHEGCGFESPGADVFEHGRACPPGYSHSAVDPVL